LTVNGEWAAVPVAMSIAHSTLEIPVVMSCATTEKFGII